MLYLTLQGFFLGFGPCLITCAPVILPYAGTKKTWQEGFFATLSFSLGRLFIYVILGGLFGYFGAFILKFYYSSGVYYYIQALLAAILILVGAAVLLGKELDFKFCGIDEGNMFVVGILVALSPCLPLIGIMLEIALLSKSFIAGFVYSFFFGIGTVVSPLLLLGAVIPHISGKVEKKLFKLFTYLCGIMLIMVGIYLIFRRAS